MQEHKRVLTGKPWLRVSMLAWLVDVEHVLADGWSFGSWDSLSKKRLHSPPLSFSPSRQPSIWSSGHRGLTQIQSCPGWNKDKPQHHGTKDSERASVRVCKKENVYFYVLEEDKNTYRGECGCENESCLSFLTMYLERAHFCLRLDI